MKWPCGPVEPPATQGVFVRHNAVTGWISLKMDVD
jgi:hypothetical protein